MSKKDECSIGALVAMTSPQSTVAADVKSIVGDERFCDVRLQGTDGDTVPAAKFILAARSKVFRTMLYGEFAEASLPVVQIGFDTPTLRLLVEYIYTDDVKSLASVCDEGTARAAVGLCTAAHYFELVELEGIVRHIVRSAMLDRVPLSCAVLDEASNAGLMAANLLDDALHVIQLSPKLALLPPDESHGRGVLSLSASTLGRILEEDMTAADELTLFKCLERWADGDPHEAMELEKTHSGQKRPLRISSRRSRAQDLVKCIQLSNIPPSQLCGYVSNCSLASPDDIMGALKEQALLAELKGITFGKLREGCVTVQGAGVPGANGTYVKSNPVDDISSYTTLGLWNGKTVIFGLFRVSKIAGGGKRWYIAVINRTGKKEPQMLYESPRGDDLVKTGWRVYREIADDTSLRKADLEPPPALNWSSLECRMA